MPDNPQPPSTLWSQFSALLARHSVLFAVLAGVGLIAIGIAVVYLIQWIAPATRDRPPMALLPFVAMIGSFITVGGAVAILIYSMKKRLKLSDEDGRLRLAAATLTGMFLLLLTSISVYATSPSDNGPGKSIFENCMKAFPPIVTLILGYWFGSRPRPRRQRDNRESDKYPQITF